MKLQLFWFSLYLFKRETWSDLWNVDRAQHVARPRMCDQSEAWSAPDADGAVWLGHLGPC
jgi:hypothetical protein